MGDFLKRLQPHWPELNWAVDAEVARSAPHEASYLYLDSARARKQLLWRPVWTLDKAMALTATWYRGVQSDLSCAESMLNNQIDEFPVSNARCRSCGAPLSRVVCDLGLSPISQCVRQARRRS